jgi:hypothetical protein
MHTFGDFAISCTVWHFKEILGGYFCSQVGPLAQILSHHCRLRRERSELARPPGRHGPGTQFTVTLRPCRLTGRLRHPFNTGRSPLNYSSSPGVKWRISQEWTQRSYNQLLRNLEEASASECESLMEMLSDGLFRRIRYGANARKPRCTLTTAPPPTLLTVFLGVSAPFLRGVRRARPGGVSRRPPRHDAAVRERGAGAGEGRRW